MKKQALVSILFLVLTAWMAPKALADGSCQPVYGGGQSCTAGNLTISKDVRNPQTNVFVHDLGISDPHYYAGDLASFQIAVSNNGNATINTVTVKDILPDYLTYDSGSGSYDSFSKTLTWTVTNLQPGQTKTYIVNARVQKDLPAKLGIVCVTNQAEATSSEGQNANDSSQLCLGKLTTTPSTGPEALGIIALLPTGLAGLALRKSAKK